MFLDLLISALIALVYIYIIYKFTIIFYGEPGKLDKDNLQNLMIILFILGFVVLIIAQTVFKNNEKLKNKPVSYGLTFGSFLILSYCIFFNWSNLTEQTKLIIFCIFMAILIWFSYYYYTDDKKTKNKSGIENNSKNNLEI